MHTFSPLKCDYFSLSKRTRPASSAVSAKAKGVKKKNKVKKSKKSKTGKENQEQQGQVWSWVSSSLTSSLFPVFLHIHLGNSCFSQEDRRSQGQGKGKGHAHDGTVRDLFFVDKVGNTRH